MHNLELASFHIRVMHNLELASFHIHVNVQLGIKG
jgi:hypothetical protein